MPTFTRALTHPLFPSLPLLAALIGCAGASTSATDRGASSVALAGERDMSRPNATLEARYELGLSQFNRGAYETAAHTFAQALLEAPGDASGDRLRHLLVQHIAWSLLGVYDMQGDASALGRGEVMLERYLVKHEALRPMADREREDIYELLGEYSLRREGEPPPNARPRLMQLTLLTQRHIAYHEVETRRESTRDTMIREIEVDAIRWARMDDPKVQRYLRDPRYTGPSFFERPPDPYNPTRVLVRGWVSADKKGHAKHDRRQAYRTLASARPQLEACYESALGRGADTLERVVLNLRWNAGVLDEAELDDNRFDPEGQRCVLEALRQAESSEDQSSSQRRGDARLHLTFFVQPARYPSPRELGASPSGAFSRGSYGGPITEGARAEDASR